MFSKTLSRLVLLLSLLTVFAAVSSKPAWMPRKALRSLASNFSGSNNSPRAARPLKQFNPKAPHRNRQVNQNGPSKTTTQPTTQPTTDPTTRPTTSPKPILDISITLGPTSTGVSVGVNTPTHVPSVLRDVNDSESEVLKVAKKLTLLKNPLSPVEPLSAEGVVSETN